MQLLNRYRPLFTAMQRPGLVQGIGAGLRRFLALVHEMFEEELLMFFPSMEVMRREHDREHRHFGFQLHLHQAADDRLGDELVAVDATIHHQAGGDDAGVAA